uniref:histone H1.5-like n=1 Tax=Pristiophorus japonicus TaxID=55135 RepID=UPI00398F4E18
MTDTAAAETAPPATAAAQTKAPRSGPAAPKLGEQILKVVAYGSDRKEMSLAAIKEALATKGADVEKRGSQIRFSIKKNVTHGSLKQIKGPGTSGSLTVAQKETSGKVGRKVKKSPAKQTSTKKATGAKVKAAKKVEKPRVKATPESAKTKKAAANK